MLTLLSWFECDLYHYMSNELLYFLSSQALILGLSQMEKVEESVLHYLQPQGDGQALNRRHCHWSVVVLKSIFFRETECYFKMLRRKKIRETESCFTCCWWRSFYIIWCCWRRNKYAITTNCKKSGFNVTKSVAESHRCPMFCYIWITIVSIILGSSEKKI